MGPAVSPKNLLLIGNEGEVVDYTATAAVKRLTTRNEGAVEGRWGSGGGDASRGFLADALYKIHKDICPPYRLKHRRRCKPTVRMGRVVLRVP